MGWQPADCFYDLGSGLGQVVMLVQLLTGMAARGVEYDPAFVDFARRQAAILDLPAVRFVNADARIADYSDGTIFFLFTPFRGAMLRTVMTRLRDIAHDHPIRVGTFGPVHRGWPSRRGCALITATHATSIN
ncbi:MAG: class I SAM-dependent methyltransferase [Caldilineaceae bacterium]